MATTVLERVPVDRISAEARDSDPGRVALTIVAAVLFAVGWAAGKSWTLMVMVMAAAWYAVAWSGTAIKVGWVTAREPGRRS